MNCGNQDIGNFRHRLGRLIFFRQRLKTTALVAPAPLVLCQRGSLFVGVSVLAPDCGEGHGHVSFVKGLRCQLDTRLLSRNKTNKSSLSTSQTTSPPPPLLQPRLHSETHVAGSAATWGGGL